MKENKKTFFTEDERKKAVEWLNEKWKGAQICEVCQSPSPNWQIAEYMVTPAVFSGGITIGRSKSYPTIQVICENCGNIKYFSATTMGLGKLEG